MITKKLPKWVLDKYAQKIDYCDERGEPTPTITEFLKEIEYEKQTRLQQWKK